jgi:hypothetical protein
MTSTEPLPEFYAVRMAETLKQLAEANGVPLGLLAPAPARSPHEVVIGDDVTLTDLRLADEALVGRIVKRAVYDAGRALLDVLDGWVEGATGNHEALGHRDADCCNTFHPEDIRVMVNDAMRLMGAPEHRIPQAGE